MYPRRGRSRRVRLGATALAAGLLTLCACTAGADPSSDPTPSGSSSARPSDTSSPSPGSPVTLRFAVYGGRQEVASYRRLARAYTAAHPEVKVVVESSADESSAQNRLQRQFTSGDAPDVFLSDSSQLPALLAGRRVQPVDQLLEARDVQFGDRFERLGLEAFAGDSALQCMPSSVSPYVVYYNKRLLVPSALADPGERVPTPETGWRWDQFARAALTMSQGRVKGVYLDPSLTTLTPLMRSAGSEIVDDPDAPTTLTLSDPGSRDDLETILQVARDSSVNLTRTEVDRQDAVTRFENGRLGMFIGTRDLVPRLREKAGLRFDVFPLPSLGRFRTVADVDGYCLSSSSDHQDQAADFIAFASKDEGAKIVASSGAVVPANLTVLRSDAFEQRNQFPRNVDVFSIVIRRSTTMPNAPGWPDVVSQTQPLLDRLFYNPGVNLDRLLPRIDKLSGALLSGPTPSPSPTESDEGQ